MYSKHICRCQGVEAANLSLTYFPLQSVSIIASHDLRPPSISECACVSSRTPPLDQLILNNHTGDRRSPLKHIEDYALRVGAMYRVRLEVS